MIDAFELYKQSVVQKHEAQINAYKSKKANKVVFDHFGKNPKKGPRAAYLASPAYKAELSAALQNDPEYCHMVEQKDFLSPGELHVFTDNQDVICDMIASGQTNLTDHDISDYRMGQAKSRMVSEGAALIKNALKKLGVDDVEALCVEASDELYSSFPELLKQHFLSNELGFIRTEYGYGYGFWNGAREHFEELDSENLNEFIAALPCGNGIKDDWKQWNTWAGYYEEMVSENEFLSMDVYAIAMGKLVSVLPDDSTPELEQLIKDEVSDEISDYSSDNAYFPTDTDYVKRVLSEDAVRGFIQNNPRYSGLFKPINPSKKLNKIIAFGGRKRH